MVKAREDQVAILSDVGATVTATNLTNLTNGSNADALHTHAAAGGPPTGSAGGDLNGTYPNPGVIGVRGSSVNPQIDNTTDLGSTSLRIKNVNAVSLVAHSDTTDTNKATLISSALTATVAFSLVTTTAGSETAGKNIVIDAGDGGISSGSANGGVGGSLTAGSGVGGAGSGSFAGGTGGALSLVSGTGGAGSVSAVGGNGGAISITAGSAGANNGGGGGTGGSISISAGNGTGNSNGGSLTLDAGALAGSGVSGNIVIGNTNAEAITIGRSTKTVTFPGRISINGTLFEQDGITANTAFDIDGNNTLFLGASTATSIGIGRSGVTTTLNGTITVSNGSVINTSGTGNVNLPNNGSARFNIQGVAVESTVTAANLNTLTNGGSGDGLHTHGGLSLLVMTAGETIEAGDLVCLNDGYGSNPRIFKADANGGAILSNVIGVADGYAVSEDTITISLVGEKLIPDAQWDSVPVYTDIGKKVYLSETAGNCTLTAPTTSGSYVVKCGILSAAGSGNSKIIIQIGDTILIES